MAHIGYLESPMFYGISANENNCEIMYFWHKQQNPVHFSSCSIPSVYYSVCIDVIFPR